ncbi:MAG: EamA family transporter [Bryobacteraceae bacterium]|nr:EamA family transporter [Bryobacteraceae bacterium]
MFRVIVATLIATSAGAVGQILMRRGMQIVGPLESYAPLDLVAYFWRALCQPYVIGGTILSAVFYFCILAALSWTDVTVAIPLTAIEYGFTAVLAVTILKEAVPPLRWAGIVFVVIGVVLISAGGGDEAPGAHQRKGRAGPGDADLSHVHDIKGSTHLEHN